MFFFRVLYILTDDFLFYLGCIYFLQAQEGFGWTAITKTGPNDARHIVWALGTLYATSIRAALAIGKRTLNRYYKDDTDAYFICLGTLGFPAGFYSFFYLCSTSLRPKYQDGLC